MVFIENSNQISKFYEEHSLENTIEEIIRLWKDPVEIQKTRVFAEKIIRNFPDRQPTKEIEYITLYIRNIFRYTSDPYEIEYVKTPSEMIREYEITGSIIGDCDDVSTLLGGIFISLGYKVRIITISTQQNMTPYFDHIFIQVLDFSKNLWYNIDGTLRGKKFNASYPYRSIKVWEI